MSDDAAFEQDEQPTSSVDTGRLAELISNGEHPFPTEIDLESQVRLAQLVRQRRRSSLKDLFAKQIAVEIHRHNSRLN